MPSVGPYISVEKLITTYDPMFAQDARISDILRVLNSIVGSGGLVSRETEVDFGTTPYQTHKVFNVIDVNITTDSDIILSKSIKSPSDGRQADEIFAETIELSAQANNGSLDIYVKSLVGSISGKFIINYTR